MGNPHIIPKKLNNAFLSKRKNSNFSFINKNIKTPIKLPITKTDNLNNKGKITTTGVKKTQLNPAPANVELINKTTIG